MTEEYYDSDGNKQKKTVFHERLVLSNGTSFGEYALINNQSR